MRVRSQREAAVLGAIWLAACEPSEPPARPSAAVLRAAVRADVSGFFPNPPAANESYTFAMSRFVLDSVVTIDRGLNVVPALAESWLTPDDRTYRLILRPGLRFSDGRPVTARDVAASLEAGRRRRWPNDGYLGTLESARALDERQLELRAEPPDPTLLARLAWGFVLPADAAAQQPVPVVGTGPYVLERWTPGTGFAFTRNPHHWGPPAPFARAEFRVVPDDEARVRLIEEGEADLADVVPPEAWARLQSRERLRLAIGPGHRVLFLGMRVDRPPFDDARVREALDLAIDRQQLLDRVFSGKGAAANQLLPRGTVGYVPELQPARLDRARSRELLRAAGLRAGHELRLVGPRNRYVHDERLMRELALQLAEVGLRVEVSAVDKRELYRRLGARDLQLFLLGWASESGDGADVFGALFAAPGSGQGGSYDGTGLRDAALDAIVREALSTSNLRARSEVLRRAFVRLAELRPILPLLVQPEAVVYDARRVAWDPPLNLSLEPRDLRPAAAPR